MKSRIYWGVVILVLLLFGGLMFYVQYDLAQFRKGLKADHEEPKPDDVEVKKKEETPEEVLEQPPAQGHLHEDGTFHEDTPHVPIEIKTPSRDYTPVKVKIPEDLTDPDVKAAWERLEYIANNIWEWGGVPSHRAVELIAQLMPPPDRFSGPSGHSDAEETINLLGELAWSGDPRAAEVVATYLCEGRVGGRGPKNALVEMGVPAVPYLVPYMLDMERRPLLRSRAIEVLGQIAVRHREELGGIVEHIIIPRLEAILSEEEPDYDEGKDAREALANLK